MPAEPTIAVLTVHDDLHALLVKQEIEATYGVRCRIVESDRVAGGASIAWAAGTLEPPSCRVVDRDGESLDLDDVDLVWWRRVNSPQQVLQHVTDLAHRDFAQNESSHALSGAFMATAGNAVWVNDPLNTRRAENKLVQLATAREVGFAIPRTCVSQNPTEVRAFCADVGDAIVKPVRGTVLRHVFARQVRPEHLGSDEQLRAAPAIYQEHVRGERHLRVQCFGGDVIAVEIRSDGLDWRENLDVPFTPVQLTTELQDQHRGLLSRLGLRMGIVDLKIRYDGLPVFLEVNPQGQFLFVQGLAGLDLLRPFARFLVGELRGDGGHRAAQFATPITGAVSGNGRPRAAKGVVTRSVRS